ncbi:MAG: hypothetical protein N2Z58_09410 [Fervidobacterium sp.]|nr:hypothetical protein [Fervidobacterium sp.]
MFVVEKHDIIVKKEEDRYFCWFCYGFQQATKQDYRLNEDNKPELIELTGWECESYGRIITENELKHKTLNELLVEYYNYFANKYQLPTNEEPTIHFEE